MRRNAERMCTGRHEISQQTPITRRDRQRGLALVVVLWTVMLIALIAAASAATSRTATNLAHNLLLAAQAEALADAGVHMAVLALLGSGEERLLPVNGESYEIAFGAGTVFVSVQNEAGKLNLNLADPDDLKALMEVLGVDPRQASALADAIADFRTPDNERRAEGAEGLDYAAAGKSLKAKHAPFDVLEELQQISGMTPALYRLLTPFVTATGRRTRIDPAVAPREVLVAIPGLIDQLAEKRSRSQPREPGSMSGYAQSRRKAFTIRAEATLSAGATYVRESLVFFPTDPKVPFEFLAWRRGQPSATVE